MTIYVNGEAKEIQDGSSISALLTQLGIDTSKGIAVAVNQKVTPAIQWNDTTLLHEDQVLLIRATKGG